MTMKSIVTFLLRATTALLVVASLSLPGVAEDQAAAPNTALSPLEKAVVRESEATVKAFNAGDAAMLGGMFLETGELVEQRFFDVGALVEPEGLGLGRWETHRAVVGFTPPVLPRS